jgi:hypothetical protein
MEAAYCDRFERVRYREGEEGRGKEREREGKRGIQRRDRKER